MTGEADLCNDQVFRKLGKPNDVIEQLRLLLEIVCAADELQRVVLEESLISLLVLVRLAQNLGRINSEVGIPCPRAVTNIFLHLIPVPAIVARKVSRCVAVLSLTTAVHVANPEKIVRLRMELKNLGSESIWSRRRIENVP
jgi:hypothetical protein